MKDYDEFKFNRLEERAWELEKQLEEKYPDKKGQEMNVIDDIIEILSEDDGAMIPRPASEEDIAGCQDDLIKLALEPLPQGFIDFLKKYNGLAWNGIEFYSTYEVTEADNPDGYKLMDLVSMNDEFNDRYELDEKVLLGRADEDYYTYNITTKKYEALELESREIWEEFDTFEDLFFFTVGGRLGLNEPDLELICQKCGTVNKFLDEGCDDQTFNCIKCGDEIRYLKPLLDDAGEDEWA